MEIQDLIPGKKYHYNNKVIIELKGIIRGGAVCIPIKGCKPFKKFSDRIQRTFPLATPDTIGLPLETVLGFFEPYHATVKSSIVGDAEFSNN